MQSQERIDKEKYAIRRLKELKELWNYLEGIHGSRNRWAKKAFRRRFITEEDYCNNLIDDCIKFYGINIMKNELEAKKESLIFPKEFTPDVDIKLNDLPGAVEVK